MANSIENQRTSSKYPISSKIGKREVSMGLKNYSVAVIDSALTMTSDDGITHVRASAAATATLPNAVENTGRIITFLQGIGGGGTLTVAQNADDANIDGSDADLTALNLDTEWISLFSTGTEWIIVMRNFA